MMAKPNSYTDPFYRALAQQTTQRLKLPVGLLDSIVQKGERSNADQVSEAGAATVAQITPATRKAALEKYGVDAYLSPENAFDVAGRLLQDSLKRNNGDEAAAISEYHGGTDRDNWGPRTQAYTQRVLGAQQNSKIDALSQGFAQFMAANPAAGQKPAATTAAPSTPANDPLTQGFGNWLEQKANSGVNAIPVPAGSREAIAADAAAAPPDPTLVDRIVGAGETGLTLATGAVGAPIGTLAGGALGIAKSVADGTFGTPEGVRTAEQGAGDAAAALTYAPRTSAGQQMAGAAGEALSAALPIAPLTAEMSALGRAAAPVGAAARDITAAGVQRIRAAAPAIADRVERTLRRNPDPAPGPAAGGSAGAQGADVTEARRAIADNLPVPISLTEGQATREPGQLAFEGEIAKRDAGRPLRERYVEQNEAFQKNFDSFVDKTGAEAIDSVEIGRNVEKALREQAQRDKNAIRSAYQKADAAGETEAPITLTNVVDHLNESAPDAATAPLLDVARARAIKLGIAAQDADGNLVPLETTLKDAERFRQAVGRATNYDAPNIRQSAIIKGLVDGETETVGGALYRQARRLRENFAKKYEDRAVVSQLLNRKRGTADRQVALEDTFKHSILDGTREDLTALRRALTASGDENGKQAWKDLQGATVNWLKDEATKNVETNMAGDRVISAAALDKAIAKLERGGKMDFVFGKQGAQQMRDMNELAKVLKTVPRETLINHSNSGSLVLAAITEAGVGSMVGLPVPILTGLKLLSQRIKDNKVRARVQRSLNPPQRPRPAQ